MWGSEAPRKAIPMIRAVIGYVGPRIRMVKGMAYDYPVPGYRVEMVNILRLWKSEAVESFDFGAFNRGDYYGAVLDKMRSETISKVLYPNDEPEIGKMLRLVQQYFFVSCSLQDMLRLHQMKGLPAERFYETFTVQLNDTHPAIAVAELMRLLVDEHRMGWEASLGNHSKDLRLYQPHPAAGGPGEMAPASFRGMAAPPSGDHFRNQPALPR